MARTRTEDFVYELCRGSFLTLWSYANPQGRTAGRELCDILVICEPDVVIFSVKEVRVKADADPQVAFQRWSRRAIDESVAQLYGADRWIASGRHTAVVRSDGTLGLPFPPPETRRVHRIAVALGADGRFPLPVGDFGKGFVHVWDERACFTILNELDTIEDFVHYLREKEAFLSSSDVLYEAEDDLLGVYLHGGRKLPAADVPIVIERNSWQKLLARPEFQAKKVADEGSYLWDRFVEMIAHDVLSGNMEFPNSLSENETALRIMARENRFCRRMLADALRDFLEQAAREIVRSRMTKSMSGVVYVLLALDPSEPREFRNAQLGLRCFVARDTNRDASTVIGLATEQPGVRKGFSWDVHYYHMPDWSGEDMARAEEIREKFGYFAQPKQTHRHEDEYPGMCPPDHGA